MAAATINIPAICLNVGPMLNGYNKEELVGSGMYGPGLVAVRLSRIVFVAALENLLIVEDLVASHEIVSRQEQS